MKHKHAELIKKWADGAKIQIKSENDDWEDVDPAWIEHCEYRIKPEYNQSKGTRMNELIEKLAKQAFGSITDPILVYEAEKFAELIVKDVRWVMQTAADDFILDENYDAVKGVGRCMRRVNQHFGVEE